MIVVADTSPLNYLILIDQIRILSQMYGRIAIPTAVQDEMLRQEAPPQVREWAANPPEWVEIHRPQTAVPFFDKDLDIGESEAISLALQLKAPIIIIDETVGRREAQAHGLRVIGTLGILRDAHALNLLDLKTAIERLKTTSFRIPAAILPELLRQE
jgi:predicted nucleic acid-binding protein